MFLIHDAIQSSKVHRQATKCVTGKTYEQQCSFIDYHNIGTRNSSGDEIANVNFFYDDIVHVLQNTIDSCINSATDRRGYVLERMCLPNSVK